MNGSFYVDVTDYSLSIEEFLRERGAAVVGGFITFRNLNYEVLQQLAYPDCKPQHFYTDHVSCRIFFPDEDEASIFAMVFGHHILYSNVKMIKNTIDNR